MCQLTPNVNSLIEPGPRASWDSNTERQQEPSYIRRQRPEPIYTLDSFDFSPVYNSYSASSIVSDSEKRESYRDISRRLDCKYKIFQNYIKKRNILPMFLWTLSNSLL